MSDSESSSEISDYKELVENNCGIQHDEECTNETYCELNIERTCNFKHAIVDKNDGNKIKTAPLHISWTDSKDNKYTGPSYLCEDCYEYGCKDCLYDDLDPDAWDKRIADGVFLCEACYKRDQVRMDMM